MITVFVLDTSVSMNQRATGGLALLDCAKSAAEHFIKVCHLALACQRFHCTSQPHVLPASCRCGSATPLTGAMCMRW